MKGKVISGIGEGAKFISMKEYRERIESIVGFFPYPGTLNIESNINLLKIEGIKVDGFVKNGRNFGGLNIFPAKLNGMNVAVIVPEKRRHGHIEIIASENLRIKYGLNDGDYVEFRFIPFIKRRRKYRLKCNGNGNIKIFYEPPYRRNAIFEECVEDGKGKKLLPAASVASYIFAGDYKKTYPTLMKWVKKRYQIMSPAVLIEYGKLKEWQVEVKLNSM
ncbi:MAG: CTP-dependent riboflavin kinase [Thermoplasmata archaeon]|nr:CTP-dependent riboflavin kinase [Thermoplasmata archaeon]